VICGARTRHRNVDTDQQVEASAATTSTLLCTPKRVIFTTLRTLFDSHSKLYYPLAPTCPQPSQCCFHGRQRYLFFAENVERKLPSPSPCVSCNSRCASLAGLEHHRIPETHTTVAAEHIFENVHQLALQRPHRRTTAPTIPPSWCRRHSPPSWVSTTPRAMISHTTAPSHPDRSLHP
jgi:hypothetical protein